MTIIVRSMYNFVNCLQFNIRYEKVERPAPVGGAFVIFYNNRPKILKLIVRVPIYMIYTSRKKIVDLKTGFIRMFLSPENIYKKIFFLRNYMTD